MLKIWLNLGLSLTVFKEPGPVAAVGYSESTRIAAPFKFISNCFISPFDDRRETWVHFIPKKA